MRRSWRAACLLGIISPIVGCGGGNSVDFPKETAVVPLVDPMAPVEGSSKLSTKQGSAMRAPMKGGGGMTGGGGMK